MGKYKTGMVLSGGNLKDGVWLITYVVEDVNWGRSYNLLGISECNQGVPDRRYEAGNRGIHERAWIGSTYGGEPKILTGLIRFQENASIPPARVSPKGLWNDG